MLISLVIPVYNAELYLDRCLDSVLKQTYLNLEVILVNDGSKDGSGALCDKYGAKDNRVKVHHQENRGHSGARNAALRIATGDYIGFIDSDDEIEPDMVADFVQVIEDFKPDFVSSNVMQYVQGNKRFNLLRNDLPYQKVLDASAIKTHFLQPYYGGYMGAIPSVWSKMYNAAFLKSNDLWFDETVKRGGDYWFNFYVFARAQTAYAIDKSYYHYFANDGSVIRSLRENQFEMFLTSRERLLRENESLHCEINWVKLNTNFVNIVNEFLLSYIRNRSILESYKKITSILRNASFKTALFNNAVQTPHVKLIAKLVKWNLPLLAFGVYFGWAKKP